MTHLASTPKGDAMPADAPPKPAIKETWIDWVPPEGREEALLDAEPLRTRDELIADLEQIRVHATARDLIHWQTHGVIPYPQVKRHQGATRALYPQWMVGVIRMLRDLQGQGYKLREIGPILRGHVYHLFTLPPRSPREQQRHDRRVAKRALYPLLDEINIRIRSLARIQERLHGGKIIRAELRLLDDKGAGRGYHFLAGDSKIQVEELE